MGMDDDYRHHLDRKRERRREQHSAKSDHGENQNEEGHIENLNEVVLNEGTGAVVAES